MAGVIHQKHINKTKEQISFNFLIPQTSHQGNLLLCGKQIVPRAALIHIVDSIISGCLL